MRRLALAMVMAGAAATTSAQDRPALKAEGLCASGEQVVFACTARRGQAYVCGAPRTDLPADKLQYAAPVTAQYRFGRPGKLAFAYPQTPAATTQVFRFSSAPYSGGGEAHLIFENDGYQYVLYDRTTAGDWNKDGTRDHTFQTGVLVRKDGRVVSNVKCTGSDDSMRAPAYDLPKTDFDYELVP